MNITQTATGLSRFDYDFDQLLEQRQFEEAEGLLADNVEETPPNQRPAPFSAPLRLKGDRGRGLTEEALVSPVVNRLSRRLRNARYRSRIEAGYRSIRILEEGDSWTQYPIVLQDIVDWVSKDFAVYSLGAPRDTVEGIALDAKYEHAIRDEQPHAFLISAGGNDLFGEGRLASYLVNHSHGARPQDLINAGVFNPLVARIVRNLREIVGRALHAKPDLKILIHGYDYARPVAGGRWLGRTLAAHRISMDLGREVIKVIVDRFNAELAQLTASFPGAVHHVDVRDKVGHHANSWHDELHPENAGFQRVADPFMAEFRRIAALAGVAASDRPELVGPRPAATNTVDSAFYSFAHKRADNVRAVTLRSLREKARRDPQVERARKDVDVLMAALDEPEVRERIEARQEYSICSGRQLSERTINKNASDEYLVLSRGVEAGRAVARLLVRRPGGGGTYGTGFLVGPNLLLTTHRVMPDRSLAATAIASFNHELDTEGNVRAPVNFRTTATVFLTSKRLDYALVGVESVSQDGRLLADFGHLPLLQRSGKALKKEFVNIIHHPGGNHKKVAIRQNLVIGRVRDLLYYVTDSRPGSSGAPIMNEEWQVAALHHMAISDRNNPDEFIAGRGVRISSILDDVSLRRNAGDGDATEAEHRLQAGRLSFASGDRDAEASSMANHLPIKAAETGRSVADCVQVDGFGEIDEAMRLSNAGRPHLSLGDAHWPNSPRNAPDTWHLPSEAADREFALTPELIERLIDAGHFAPVTDGHDKLIVSLRGCRFVDGSDFKEDETSIELRPVNPDHEDFRCLIGVFDTAVHRISLYRGSTVPHRTGMLGYYDYVNFNAARRMCNLLPTGCYRHCVGTHYSDSGPVTYVLRLGDGPEPANSGVATVLRTSNDLSYGTRGEWDRTRTGDNIHPAFSGETFSSSGCLTVRGSQEHGRSHATATGEWRRFRRKAGFDGEHRGRLYDNLLVTGHEAAAVAAAIAGGDADRLMCLRHGSAGDLVRCLQKRLGVEADGNCGAVTMQALTRLQQRKLDFATGTWTHEMAALLRMPFGP